MMKRHLAYLRYVARHKWFVFQACRRCNVSLWQAIIHDWHKFLPSEWAPYAATFYASDGSKQYKPTPEFLDAWRLHQKRGKHHWQHWITLMDMGHEEYCLIPEKYLREMVADWLGAGHAINGAPVDVTDWKWLLENWGKIRMHEQSREDLKVILWIVGVPVPLLYTLSGRTPLAIPAENAAP